MSRREATPERMGALSDGVFAIIITILVLDLKPPEAVSFSALLSLWPRGLSYALSYLFLAVVRVNHHYLLRYASLATHVPPQMKRMMRMRSVVTLLIFTIAAGLALASPIAGMALICLCLVVYLRPEAPGIQV